MFLNLVQCIYLDYFVHNIVSAKDFLQKPNWCWFQYDGPKNASISITLIALQIDWFQVCYLKNEL